MSVQFGRWNFDGRPVGPEYLRKVGDLLAPYGPDGEATYIKGGTAILCHALHTTQGSRVERQPFVLNSGEVLTWDGRLDNRPELTRLLESRLSQDPSDGTLAATAYERWGTNCFTRLIGDWALAIWNPVENLLTLAKDPIGTRHLYYTTDRGQITWSSILDPLVLLAEKTFDLDEEYIAGWLGMFPAADLTPYVGIWSIPPSHFVQLYAGRRTAVRYWDFNPAKKVRYASDEEYEEHFRAVFQESVRRRLCSDAPVLAELSGGIDSSSIVCLADSILAQGRRETPRLDTVSYFDDSEPNWNEQPYVAIVEGKRGRPGCHIDLRSGPLINKNPECEGFAAAPSSRRGPTSEVERQFAEYLSARGSRVVISGIGGDEIAGGVPTAIPELMDLLAAAQFRSLASQLKLWALDRRTPWFFLLFKALREFLPPALVGIPSELCPPSWVRHRFIRRHRSAFTGYSTRTRLFGAAPSFQANLSTLDLLRRQLACTPYPSAPVFEKRYPFLDRDFLEFLCAVPREQLVRPGQRRSLMRRAMAGIVPHEVLNRRRKAFVSRRPTLRLASESAALAAMSETLASTSLGIVDAENFRQAILRAGEGQQIHVVAMARTLALESWLRAAEGRGILTGVAPKAMRAPRGRFGSPKSGQKALLQHSMEKEGSLPEPFNRSQLAAQVNAKIERE